MAKALKTALLLAALTATTAAGAELTAADVLKSAPSLIVNPLSTTKVADLIEYARAGMLSHAEKNAAGAEARILALDSIHAELQTGPGRVLAFELLPVKNDTVIAVIETITSQMADSRMTIYSRDWTPLPRLWKEPAASAWGKLDEVPVVMARYSYSPSTRTLTLTNTSEERDRMKPALTYTWTAKGFRPAKK